MFYFDCLNARIFLKQVILRYPRELLQLVLPPLLPPLRVIHLPRLSRNRLSTRRVLRIGINNQNIKYYWKELVFTRGTLSLKLSQNK